MAQQFVGDGRLLELTEGALFYAREANADAGLAFILEYARERCRFSEITHILARLGGMVDAASRCGNSPTASFTMSVAKSSEWSSLPITD